TLVMVDGFRVNDPQTGHHNLNLPIPLEEVERVEILRGHGSSLYGADAFGGVINIITKRPEKRSIMLEGGIGGDFTRYGLISLQEVRDDFYALFSLEKKGSNGYKHDTDFDISNVFGKVGVDFSSGNLEFTLGHQDKEFGAFDFYSPGKETPSREWTKTRLFTLKVTKQIGETNVEGKLLIRHHEDDFMFDIRNPGLSFNHHTTILYVGEIVIRSGLMALGIEGNNERIKSSNLGSHNRNRMGVYGEYSFRTSERLSLIPSLRIDVPSDYSIQWNPAMSLSYKLNQSYRLRGSVGRCFRVPSYTELFYQDPANKGNPHLKPEKAWSYEVGADYDTKNLKIGISIFRRDESDVIDWVKFPAGTAWQAINSGKINVFGFEASGTYRLSNNTLQLNYAYIEKDLRKPQDYESKYVLRHPRHQASLIIHTPLPYQLSQFISLTYKEREGEKGFFLMDAKLRRTFSKGEIYLEATNLLNTNYEEVIGVTTPGRTIMAGLKWFI
ncbi:MAG: TonB-dependent receptor, partial [Nitrospira sp.]|nr:TonB-dependent receptor [Nitrospira sp.]